MQSGGIMNMGEFVANQKIRHLREMQKKTVENRWKKKSVQNENEKLNKIFSYHKLNMKWNRESRIII